MKKFMAIIFAVVMVASLAACEGTSFGSSQDKDTENSVQTEIVTVSNQLYVPDVVGMKSDDAMETMTDANINFTLVEVSSDKVEPGFVVSQSPTAGKTIEPDAEVSIYVSKETKTDTKTDDNSKVTLYSRADQHLTLRDIPSRTGIELKTIPVRGAMTYINTSGEYYYVDYKGVKGYVLSDFVSTDINAPLNTGTGNVPYLTSNDVLYCRANDKASLRASASRSANRLALVQCREKVTYLGATGEFYYVSYRGTKGYVLKDYFSTDYNAPLNYGDY